VDALDEEGEALGEANEVPPFASGDVHGGLDLLLVLDRDDVGEKHLNVNVTALAFDFGAAALGDMRVKSELGGAVANHLAACVEIRTCRHRLKVRIGV